jgi:diguanylate cyclase (GGDEF)-like protein
MTDSDRPNYPRLVETPEDRDLGVALDEANTRLERLTTIDPLTETLNRRGIETAIWHHLARDRRSGSSMAVILLCCDDIHPIIDNLGHAVGDVVLTAIAARINDTLRPSDQIGRIDRDTFMVLLPETRVAEAAQVAEKLRFSVSRSPVALSPKPLNVNMKVAVVKAPRNTCSIEEILELARHEIRLQHPGITIDGVNPVSGSNIVAMPHLADLGGAVENERFRAVSQPIVSLDDERVIGHELLSRGPAGALEMPVDFFRIALESNMLSAVDLSCLKACVNVSRMLAPKGKLHLNLFPSTILGTSTERLLELLECDDDVTFCIEISEQQFIGDPACLRDHVTAFKKRGIQVSIDDVGFGRSCLETLIMLEPDVVKIDRSYVDGAAGDPHKGRLLDRLVQVSQTLGAEIVAEGIETREDYELCRDFGVQYGQGWLWGKADESFIQHKVAS